MSEQILRRIPLEKFVDLKVDFAFKQLFGSEKNKQITVVFLNAILKRTGRNTIKEVAFVSQEAGGDYVEDKQSRLDILVKTQANEFINIEIQLTNQYDMVKRTLYYWSRMYHAQLQKGMGYNKLLPAITINICNFNLFNQTKSFHNTFHLYEDEERFRVDDVLEIHFIEMQKFIRLWYEKKLDPWNNILARWLLLLGMVDARKGKVYEEIYKELEELAMNDENLRDAFAVWQNLGQSPEQFLAYQSRLKYILDEEAKLDDVRYMSVKEGVEQGIEQGEQKKELDILRNALSNNLDPETIATVTGLSLEYILEIKKKLNL